MSSLNICVELKRNQDDINEVAMNPMMNYFSPVMLKVFNSEVLRRMILEYGGWDSSNAEE